MEDMNSWAGGALCKMFSGMYNVVTITAREKSVKYIFVRLKHKLMK